MLACEQAPCEDGKNFGERRVNPAAKREGICGRLMRCRLCSVSVGINEM